MRGHPRSAEETAAALYYQAELRTAPRWPSSLQCLSTPMTTSSRPCPTGVAVVIGGQTGQIVLDPLRTVDKARLVRRLGRIADPAQQAVLGALAEMFAP
jgi:mRNA-degrading endonuclease toxin of MazEF toxin-antitoxin module